MLRNYITIAWRILIRNRFYAGINIAGLAIGIACFTMAVLFVNDERNYDRFHSKADRIYRVCEELNTEGSGENSSSCPFPVAQSISNDYPDLVEESVRFFNFQDPQHTFRFEERKFNESNVYLADSSVFRIFDFPLVKGNPDQVLARPNTIVLTPEMAIKYFGNADPIGKLLTFDGVQQLEVTGILKALPPQTHLRFDALISFSSLRNMMGPFYNKNWVWNPAWTYVLLKKDADPAELERRFPAFVTKYYPDFLKKSVRHYLQPLTSIHLNSRLAYEMHPNGEAQNIWIFSLIGLFILIIACINYMTMSTARSASRSQEIGIRKVLGAERGQLIRQLLSESLVFALLAVCISALLIELMLPFFNSVAGKQLSIQSMGWPKIILMLLVAGLFSGLLAGAYPAIFLSGFRPVSMLKKTGSSRSGKVSLRKVLVVTQFIISLIIITSTWIIYSQLNYLRTAGLGFDKEQVMLIPMRPPMYKLFQPFVAKLRDEKGVMEVTAMNDVIGKHHNTHEYNYKGMEKGKWVYFPSLLVDESFIPAMDMEIIAGRNFSKAFPRDDSLAVIINEAMLGRMGWKSPQEALGQQFYTPTGGEKVVGVVKNFHFETLRNPVGPFVLDLPHPELKPFWTRYIAIRLAPGDRQDQINRISMHWTALSQDYPFDYSFLDEQLNLQYTEQENLARLFTGFSLLAVFIAGLGLLALSAYSAEQRTREIGIRKVLGASASSIVRLLTFDFLRLVILANIIALPLTWYLMHMWLNNFAFRITMPPLAFATAAMMSLLLAFLTISFQSLKASMINPVQSLKYE